MCSDWPILGSATFTIEMSSTTMNCAAQAMASTAHEGIGAWVAASSSAGACGDWLVVFSLIRDLWWCGRDAARVWLARGRLLRTLPAPPTAPPRHFPGRGFSPHPVG